MKTLEVATLIARVLRPGLPDESWLDTPVMEYRDYRQKVYEEYRTQMSFGEAAERAAVLTVAAILRQRVERWPLS